MYTRVEKIEPIKLRQGKWAQIKEIINSPDRELLRRNDSSLADLPAQDPVGELVLRLSLS